MANSRKSKRSKRAAPGLAASVAAELKALVRPGDRLLLGLSGGVDSIALLDVLARLRKRLRFDLRALHVNHQLSANAASWARFCRAQCRLRDIPCRVVKVVVARRDSVERAAREARYGALHGSVSDYIVLAHNADDQAETVLLQLLRGSGVKGLAAMPFVTPTRRAAAPARKPLTAILRPFIAISRAQIEEYAQARRLEWIEDESNEDTAYLRNWLRRDILPRIAVRLPAYRETLTLAARHFGEASELLDALAAIDSDDAPAAAVISAARLQTLSLPRAKNVLRSMIAARGWRMPQAHRLTEALRQALTARADAKVIVALGECELRRHGGVIHILPRSSAKRASSCVPWRGEREMVLSDLHGVLTMVPVEGSGIRADAIEGAAVTIRTRKGGECLQFSAGRPRRTVKNLLQEARMPVWERERLPFIYCGETLVCVPGIGVDYRYRAQPGERAVLPVWQAR